MPVMSGHELLAEVRANHQDLSEPPFIFLSALSDRENVIEGKLLGADDYLTKPIDFDLLFATVRARLLQVERLRACGESKLVKLYTRLAGSANADAVDPPPAAPPEDVRGDVTRLAERNHGAVTVSRLQMVGLRAVRQELGPQWPALATKVRALAEGIIRAHLAPEDVFTRRADDEFVLCFASLTEDRERSRPG
jgi:DNA-binding response OmpR family regulator